MHKHPGWRCGEIRNVDENSGQIHVVYEHADKNYLYWTHIDNEREIAQFTSKSGTDIPKKQVLLSKSMVNDQCEINAKSGSVEIQKNDRKRGNSNSIDDDLMMEPPRKKQKLSMNTQRLNDERGINEVLDTNVNAKQNSNNLDSPRIDSNLKPEDMNALILENKSLRDMKQEIVTLKSILTGTQKENTKLKKDIDEYKKEIELLKQYNLRNIETMNREKLQELENKMKNNLQEISQQRERMMDDSLLCIICFKNEKNVLIHGCNHFEVCSGCLVTLPKKECPRCHTPFANTTVINK